MSGHARQIQCAKCGVALRGPSDAKPNDRLECPECGEGDTLAIVIEEVKNHEMEQARSKTTMSLKDLKAGKSPVISAGPGGDYRFVWRDVRGPLH